MESTATLEQIKYANRVRELSRMSKGQLGVALAKAKGGRHVYGQPSKDELIHEVLVAEGLLS